MLKHLQGLGALGDKTEDRVSACFEKALFKSSLDLKIKRDLA